jgi:class 3 adenylate cyclase
MILNSSLISIEVLELSVPVNFTLALHYGKTPYQAPGKTGTVISDAVNFVFHLGSKCAEPGRLTISEEVPDEALPPALNAFFTAAGEFEGLGIRHSRRFTRST